MKIFWSWQSDTPGTTGRYLIRDALRDAIKQLKQTPEIEEALRREIELDSDIQNTPGSPDIARPIFRKIDQSDVVVGNSTHPKDSWRKPASPCFTSADAEGLLRQAAQARPPNYRAQIELARYHLDTGHLDRDGAEMAARQALNVDRSRTEAYNILAGIYADRAEWTSLDSILKEASQQNPDDLAPYYYAADHLLSAGREPARAERYLRLYLNQESEGNEPRKPDACWKLGLALEVQGRSGEAVAEW